MLTLYSLARAVFDPFVASQVAAILCGSPELGPRLVEICLREARGRCELVGVHEADSGHSSAAWEKATAVGWLQPATCPWHRYVEGAWSTRGVHGQIAAYSLRHLPCAPPWVLDVPLVSAYVALRRMTSPMCLRTPRCRSWAGLPNGATGPNDLDGGAPGDGRTPEGPASGGGRAERTAAL
jgi:hypothetical protein